MTLATNLALLVDAAPYWTALLAERWLNVPGTCLIFTFYLALFNHLPFSFPFPPLLPLPVLLYPPYLQLPISRLGINASVMQTSAPSWTWHTVKSSQVCQPICPMLCRPVTRASVVNRHTSRYQSHVRVGKLRDFLDAFSLISLGHNPSPLALAVFT